MKQNSVKMEEIKINIKALQMYSDLLNKRAHPNKRAGRENFFIYYIKNRVQGGKICHLLHEKLLQGGLFFQKC